MTKLSTFLLLLTGLLLTTSLNAQDPQQKLLELNEKGSELNFYASDGEGGWVIIFDDYGYSYYNFPADCGAKIKELNKIGKKIKSIAFGPDGEWVIIYGTNGYYTSGISDKLSSELDDINNEGLPIESVAFTPDGGWVVIFDEFGVAYLGIPEDCLDKLTEINEAQRPIKSVAFTPDGGWAIVYGYNGYWASDIPRVAQDKLDQVNEAHSEMVSLAFNEKGEFALTYDYNGFWCNLSSAEKPEPVVVDKPNIHNNPPPPPANESTIPELNTAAVSDVKMWAVVVGVADYAHINALRFTDDDAYKFAMFLKSPEGGALSDAQLKILIDEDATRARILSTMKEVYAKADTNDVIVFYFSGHGQNGAFLPIDYDGRNNRLTHAEVRKAFTSSRAKHKIVIADACHSGSLDREATDRDALDANLIADFYEAWEDSKGGTALLMSSAAAERSIEFSGIRQGVFSYYLIKGLKGDADADHDRIVTIREIYNYTRKGVRDYTRNRQNPVLNGDFDEDMPIGIVR